MRHRTTHTSPCRTTRSRAASRQEPRTSQPRHHHRHRGHSSPDARRLLCTRPQCGAQPQGPGDPFPDVIAAHPRTTSTAAASNELGSHSRVAPVCVACSSRIRPSSAAPRRPLGGHGRRSLPARVCGPWWCQSLIRRHHHSAPHPRAALAQEHAQTGRVATIDHICAQGKGRRMAISRTCSCRGTRGRSVRAELEWCRLLIQSQHHPCRSPRRTEPLTQPFARTERGCDARPRTPVRPPHHRRMLMLDRNTPAPEQHRPGTVLVAARTGGLSDLSVWARSPLIPRWGRSRTRRWRRRTTASKETVLGHGLDRDSCPTDRFAGVVVGFGRVLGAVLALPTSAPVRAEAPLATGAPSKASTRPPPTARTMQSHSCVDQLNGRHRATLLRLLPLDSGSLHAAGRSARVGRQRGR